MNAKTLNFCTRSSIYLLIVLINILFISCLNSNDNFEEWGIYQFHTINGNNLDYNNNTIIAVPFIFYNKNSSFEIRGKEHIAGNFEIKKSKNDSINISFSNVTDYTLNGSHNYIIDTISKSKSSLELRLLIISEKLYIEGRRSVFKGIRLR